ncbi:hypothetical protein [Pandoraea norimbergensis]|uniref:Uncharacterized protein n=1 Tax=Pandoraea norimbergensis TaxID=93219 RepID=A0ABN4JHE4_9BURK|nr:hypothetical protein [Pandoraea norimbergensis]ALS60164.1 hypothetical protein AT302_10690 [Pandoraea norimbergensis]
MSDILFPYEADANPNTSQTEQLKQAIAEIQEAVSDYRSCAGDIDDEFEKANEHRRLSLDDLPYGEEMVRTQELPASLRHAARLLEPGFVSMAAFNEARAIVIEVHETLEDCTPLPADTRDPD